MIVAMLKRGVSVQFKDFVGVLLSHNDKSLQDQKEFLNSTIELQEVLLPMLLALAEYNGDIESPHLAKDVRLFFSEIKKFARIRNVNHSIKKGTRDKYRMIVANGKKIYMDLFKDFDPHFNNYTDKKVENYLKSALIFRVNNLSS